MKPTLHSALVSRACELLGSQMALATAIDAPPAQVSQWFNGNRPVPIKYQNAIERATKAAVKRCEFSPDDYWLIWPDLKAPKKQKQAA